MTLKDVVEKILSTETLPGDQAHNEFSPMSVKVREKIKNDLSSYRKGAVLILLYPSEYGVSFVLTQRHEYEGTHSGQVSLPGGKVEEGEALSQAALRETEEEIGVGSITILKQMSNVYIPPSNFLVTPFIGYSEVTPSFVREEFEVKEILEVSLLEFLKQNIELVDLPSSKSLPYLKKVPSFYLQNKMVWGATGMILNEFKHLII